MRGGKRPSYVKYMHNKLILRTPTVQRVIITIFIITFSEGGKRPSYVKCMHNEFTLRTPTLQQRVIITIIIIIFSEGGKSLHTASNTFQSSIKLMTVHHKTMNVAAVVKKRRETIQFLAQITDTAATHGIMVVVVVVVVDDDGAGIG